MVREAIDAERTRTNTQLNAALQEHREKERALAGKVEASEADWQRER